MARRSSHLLILSEDKETYVAHKSVNGLHYELGERVLFSCYMHERIKTAKIRKRLGRSDLAKDLYNQAIEMEYVSVTFKDIALQGGLRMYCLHTRRQYKGILRVNNENFYLFL